MITILLCNAYLFDFSVTTYCCVSFNKKKTKTIIPVLYQWRTKKA